MISQKIEAPEEAPAGEPVREDAGAEQAPPEGGAGPAGETPPEAEKPETPPQN